jgi:transcriptional regulator with XRE-family HTH domain
MKKLKSNIGWLIEKSDYSREDMMKLFNKSRNTISNWCTGKSYPSVPEMYYLAELLECEVGDLYKVIEE